MVKSVRADSEAEFPEPHRFGVWARGSFWVYSDLSRVKGAISSSSSLCDYDGKVRWEIKIYEHTGESWELIYMLPAGSDKQAHELWGGVAPKTMTVSQSAVDAAIASIQSAMKET